MAPKSVFVTGANGYIGNAVCRAFVRAGWITYGLVRSEKSTTSLAVEEIVPVVGSIDDVPSHDSIRSRLPTDLSAIVSTTENVENYVPHYENIVKLLRTVSLANEGGKPLVMFTSGCKDYGVGPHFANDPALSPHTEESPINPPGLLANRAKYSLQFLEHRDDAFEPVLVRPTNVYGRSSSYYLAFFQVAEETAKKKDRPLIIDVPEDSVCHALHVDDCGDAYVALASHSTREEIAGQVFNISARRYETVGEIANVLAEEYRIATGVRYVDEKELKAEENPDWPPALINFPQWTGSEKIRKVTGWRDHRPLFSEAIHVYRIAYEANNVAGHENVKKTADRIAMFRADAELRK